LLDTRKSVQPSQAKDVLKGQPTRGSTRKPTDFDTIHPKAEEKHGISIDRLKTDGFTFSHILNQDLITKLNSCDDTLYILMFFRN
jgi:hypothetical protein